eukprot:TRINITY_DN111814_c0_g1_i1.p1 TRINITY_DN111814_c0_g1~~TRINITY_DN111814_c0_g1_i1.p1  ORF type:complete len:600 (+),score=84.58 TRINITY_DN111814_c0_g1_i1:40-1800(+)
MSSGALKNRAKKEKSSIEKQDVRAGNAGNHIGKLLLAGLIPAVLFACWFTLNSGGSRADDTSKPTASKSSLYQSVSSEEPLPTRSQNQKSSPSLPSATSPPTSSGQYAWEPRSVSVVLPCAGEGHFAVKTVKAVYKETPADLLHEIIVVDDGSSPPLASSHITKKIQEKYKTRLIRQDQGVGLIKTKQAGGDAATGDVIVFFDCHVAPQPGWHKAILDRIRQNYRRIIVPLITDLDIDTWKQRGGAANGNAKCYATWDADFKWFNSHDPYIPVLSGGLLAISRRWWSETGGYDSEMYGWGGENVEQSLRTWLCGGEIMVATDAHVAHMWRKAEDPRTMSQYHVPAGSPQRNRLRAAFSWYGNFSQKLSDFPMLYSDMRGQDGKPWYGSLKNVNKIKKRLQCEDFAWFLHRFKEVYVDGGLIPEETFHIRRKDGCLRYQGPAGTSMDGHGVVRLAPCDPNDDRQKWHGANSNHRKGGSCCSGIRAWNTDQCIVYPTDDGKELRTYVCSVNGDLPQQFLQLGSDGKLGFQANQHSQSKICIGSSQGVIRFEQCDKKGLKWRKEHVTEPVERKLYNEWLKSQDEKIHVS